MAPLVFNRAEILTRHTRRVEAYLGSDGRGAEETFTPTKPAGDPVPVTYDPAEVVWSETPGGGRDMVEMVVFCAHGLIPTGTIGDIAGRRWTAVDARESGMFAGQPGDEVSLHRVFGRST